MILTIVFIVLKLTNVISWSWFWVFVPLCIDIVLRIVRAFLKAGLSLISGYIKHLEEKGD